MVPELVIGLAFLTLASLLVFEFTPRRPLQYPLAFGAFGLFLVVGVRAAGIVVLAAAIGALVRSAATHRRLAAPAAGPAALLIVGGALALGILVASGLARLLDVTFPVTMGRARSLGELMAILCTGYLAFVVAKEVGAALILGARRERGAPRAGGMSVYVAGLVIGAPMQLAAHALYQPDHLLSWTLALGWSVLVNRVIGREVARMHENVELAAELARNERLAAIGEMSARVMHHARHQMGLVGMITHRMARRLDGVPADDARALREELANLQAVQEELSGALASELHGSGASAHAPGAAPAAASSYEALVRAEVALLAPLASEHGIALRVEVEAGTAAGSPRAPDRLGQAFLNVLENAIVAAAHTVAVEVAAERGMVVLSVADDGPGMDGALLARATEPFVTTKPEGSGMGLAIARAVVEEEGGELSIRNRPEGGLLVRMLLPSRVAV